MSGLSTYVVHQQLIRFLPYMITHGFGFEALLLTPKKIGESISFFKIEVENKLSCLTSFIAALMNITVFMSMIISISIISLE
mmetsp:Transcript_21515/g.26351  ORF Transcript_21515/g.26351 Transcript_21515/m.26351 type:complete len:82 (+) Transcript_21515:366-611(+)